VEVLQVTHLSENQVVEDRQRVAVILTAFKRRTINDSAGRPAIAPVGRRIRGPPGGGIDAL
jgi:hypothetical protein